MCVKLSVIIPVYNAEKYLNKCLDSLICQSMKEMEIISVNDGSIDCKSKKWGTGECQKSRV